MKNIKKIELRGMYYENLTEIELCENESNRVSLIYGDNGSGKSCICKAFDELILEKDEGEYAHIELIDFDNQKVSLTDEKKEKIYVFNENFIEKKLKFDEKVLKAIVMFGEQVEVDEKIKSHKIKISETIEEKEKIDLKKYEDETLNTSLKKQKEAIINELRRHWASREKEIKALSRNASVTDSVYKSILGYKSSEKSLKQMREELSNLLKVIESARDDSERITIDKWKDIEIDEDNIITLLLKKIDKPGSTELEKRIIQSNELKGKQFIDSSKKDFLDKKLKHCPYCYQELSEEHKYDVLNTIATVFSDIVDEHIEELKNNKINFFEINVDQARKVEIELVDLFYSKITKCNELISKYNDYLEMKIDNVFEVINLDNLGLNKTIEEAKTLYEKIVDKTKKFNRAKDELDKNILNAQKINMSMAKIETEDLFTKLKEAKSTYLTLKGKYQKIIDSEKVIQEQIRELKAKKSNIIIAKDLINHYLAIIFGDNKRLNLEPSQEGDYRVKSKDKHVELKNLSKGEKNAIALCYFFSEIQRETDVGTSFHNELLIVLDDPISSFDYDNKVGTYSFLRMIFSKILKSNNETKIIFFTHDIEVMQHMGKVMIDFQKSNNLNKNSFCTLRIKPNKLTEKMNLWKINSYSKLLSTIFDYATREATQSKLEYSIGNMMRKVLEAFATFQYGCGIESLYRKEKIFAIIVNKKQRTYFKNRMNKLLLHSESHAADGIRNIINRSTLEYFSKDEKIKAAQDILAFMYLLYSKHIEAHFKDENKLNQIKLWSEKPLNI